MRAFSFIFIVITYLKSNYNKYNIHIYTNVSILHKTWILLEGDL